MTESYPDLRVQQPFHSDPSMPTTGGCGKPALIGCGVLILLFGVASIFLMVKARDMFAWIVTRMEVEVVRVLPDGTDAVQKERLSRAFRAARDSILDGELDPLELQDLQQQLARVTKIREGKMSPEDVMNLILALEKVGGIQPQESLELESSPPINTRDHSTRSISVGLQRTSRAVSVPSSA